MTATALNNEKPKNLRELFLWWIILAIFAAAALLLPASRARAQGASAGPLPAAAPSDQPPPSPRAAAPAEIGGKPNLSGTWALNKDESDDPRETMQQSANSGGQGGQGGGGGRVHVGMGGGGGWGGRGGSGQGAGGGRRGGQEGSGNAMNDLSQITIEQTASSAKVTGESGRVLALYSATDSSHANPSTGSSSNPSNSSSTAPTGSESSGSSAHTDSASASPAAQWQGTQLVAVTPGRREGSSTTRTYELSPDGKQLFVTTKMESPRLKKPVTFRLVYDPAPSGG